MNQTEQLKTSLELIKLMTKSLEESHRKIREQDMRAIEALVFFLSRSGTQEVADFLAFRDQSTEGNGHLRTVRDNPLEILKMVQEAYYPMFQEKGVSYKEFLLREDLVISFQKETLISFLVLFYKELLQVLAPSSQVLVQTQIEDAACRLILLCRQDKNGNSFQPSEALKVLAGRLSGECWVEQMEEGFFKAGFSLPL